jgi:hypothetical protein
MKYEAGEAWARGRKYENAGCSFDDAERFMGKHETRKRNMQTHYGQWNRNMKTHCGKGKEI